jgi:DNA-binding CsgD family transcriptional regulator
VNLSRSAYLDERQVMSAFKRHEIKRMVVAGKSNKEIGNVLGISASAVGKYLTDIYKEEGVKTRLELTVKYIKRRL